MDNAQGKLGLETRGSTGTEAVVSDNSEKDKATPVTGPTLVPPMEAPDVVAAVEAVSQEQAAVDNDPHHYTSNLGIKFKLKRVPKLVILEAGKRIKIPAPPQVYIEGKDRFEPNSNDPHYLEEVTDAKFRQGLVSINVSLSLGTELVRESLAMSGLEPPEATGWSDNLRDFDLEIPTEGRMRYISWIKYYALDDVEMNALARKIMQNAGVVFQEDVVEATTAFPGAEA